MFAMLQLTQMDAVKRERDGLSHKHNMSLKQAAAQEATLTDKVDALSSLLAVAQSEINALKSQHTVGLDRVEIVAFTPIVPFLIPSC